MLYKYGKRTSNFGGVLYFNFSLVFFYVYFGGIFDETIIPFAPAGYKIIVAISYPTLACGIIVNYSK